MMRKSEIARMAAAAICATLLAGLAACGTAAPAGSDAQVANPGAQPDSSIVIQEAASAAADGGHEDHAEHTDHADAGETQADQAAADTATAGDSAATDTTAPATTAASTGGGSGCCNE
ncbi:hypothetical protein [Bifidobacterium vespertilionis]|uniref:hypothetical protein n=1 Tax=Bifidobacterium vespertilionis TaxID=2562524 RepID=UPI001BDD1CC7|nr:hypothetical protein [Bifidobacterium vespertilionis]MBT1179663.1 hypothetical protein [Bifidobacterium vespertilionis]